MADLTRFLNCDWEDYYVGTNMFVYWGPNNPSKSSGPDFLFLQGVPRWPERHIWAAWREENRFPDVIVELMSPTIEAGNIRFHPFRMILQSRSHAARAPQLRRFSRRLSLLGMAPP